MLVLTVISLVYIHLQVQIVELAYAGKQKTVTVQALRDDHNNLTYQICLLQSAYHLGDTLLAEDSGMLFLDNDHIVRLASQDTGVDEYFASVKTPLKRQNLFARLFSLKAQAEAGPIR